MVPLSEFDDSIDQKIKSVIFWGLRHENNLCSGTLPPSLQDLRIVHQCLLIHEKPNRIPGVNHDGRSLGIHKLVRNAFEERSRLIKSCIYKYVLFFIMLRGFGNLDMP